MVAEYIIPFLMAALKLDVRQALIGKPWMLNLDKSWYWFRKT
jgi:hypothetical protein